MKPILFNLPLPIETPRLILTSPQIGDGPKLNKGIIESFELLHKAMPWAITKPSMEDSEEFVRKAAANWILKECAEPWLPLFIFDKQSHDFIGATGFHNINWQLPSVETGYWIHSKYMGNGLMIEAINAITQYAFRQLNVRRIAITCDIDNTRSKNIPEKLGFTLEGTLKAHRIQPLGNIISDTLIYARYNLIDIPPLDVSW